MHPVDRRDFLTVPDDIYFSYFVNAFYCGDCGPDGIVVYGEGLPAGIRQSFDFFAAGLDVVSHELAHGVTDHTSGLIYQNESGALNEAFSDVIGVSVEFFMAESGRHRPEQADYLVGEDVRKPFGFRSLVDPLRYGDPDHYSIRFLGSSDNGGVHTNSLIAGHAFYLAIEGGINRTSGLSVRGVGSQNRAQVEQGVLPRVHDADAGRCDVCRRSRDDAPVGPVICSAPDTTWSGRFERRGPPLVSSERRARPAGPERGIGPPRATATGLGAVSPV